MTYETECPHCGNQASAIDDDETVIVQCDRCQTATTIGQHPQAA